MKSFIAFMKKELLDQLRSGRLVILLLIFILFGIMNPAIAKLTPWLLDLMAESLAESGMSIAVAKGNALDSWLQFYKNLPMELIAFVLLESSIFTKEYSSGTLVLSLTKGLKRYKVLVSKASLLIALWSVGYWISFGVTYIANGYFWDNAMAQNLIFSAVCWWIFGLFTIALMILFSAIVSSNIGVLFGVGGVVLVSFLIGFLPRCGKYLPSHLSGGTALIYGAAEAKSYLAALIITIAISIACIAISIPIFHKKQL